MSLLAPRPQQLDRASVVLPTVTCSSCAAPIPLSSLGEHVCRGPVRPSGSRIAQRPSQITIPSSSGPSRRTDPSPSCRPSQVGSSSSTNSPANLAMPPRAAPSGKSPLAAPSPNGLYPSPTPSPRTPSPTNPFFPHPVEQGQRQAQIVHGLGLGVAARTDGPYPNDAPLSAVVPDLSMLDTSSGGNAGMAGVGRRAFAAAAWSVRAGVALASSARPQEQAQPQQPSQTHQQYPQRPKQQQHPGFPQPQPQSRPELEHRAASAPSATLPSRLQPRPEQTTRGSRILPKVPLSGRQASGTLTNAAQPIQPPRILMPASPPQRSASAMGPDPSIVPSPPGQRSTPAMSNRSAAPTRKGSSSSFNTDRSDSNGDHIAALTTARTADSTQTNAKLPFFERYKQMVSSSSGGSATVTGSSPALGIGSLSRRRSSDLPDEELVASPVQTTFSLDDEYEDGQPSALPWATPMLAESPPVGQGPAARADAPRLHTRHHTADSDGSSHSSSSSRSGRFGLPSAESEEVVTPSRSLQGLAERAGGSNSISSRLDEGKKGLTYDIGAENRDDLEQIGEEEEDDEDELVVLGAIDPPFRRASEDAKMEASISASTSTSRDAHSRSRTVPDIKRSSGNSIRGKTCQKCGETVGGANRFVERDDVVLCERDWKKLYLPSCRRCNLPIEKSAVSSSDGQLKGKWHRACFTCTRCDKPFEGDSFYVHGGRPWCQQHYHEENGTVCASAACRQPIEGPCILTAHQNLQRFHPGHLRCDHRGGVSGAQTCRESMDDYYDVAGGRYCERHVAEALRTTGGDGRGGRDLRAEKRKTRLVDLPVGGF